MGAKARQIPKDSGKWYVCINHQNWRKSYKAINQKDAEGKVEKINALIALGQYEIPEQKEKAQNFRDYAAKVIGRKDDAHNTVRSLTTQLNHINAVFGKTPLDKIKKRDIKDFLIEKKNGGLSLSSVRLMAKCFRLVLGEAVEDELIPVNPMPLLKNFLNGSKDEEPEPDPFTEDELRKIEATALKEYPSYFPLILTRARTGMRNGEAFALRWEDIDYEAGLIHIERQYTRGHITKPKSKNSIRQVDASPQLLETLKVHEQTQPSEWVFTNAKGNLIFGESFAKSVWYPLLKKAEVRRREFYQLRHTYASIRINKGDNLADVSRQLGHSSIAITDKLYYKHKPGQHKAQVNALDDPVYSQNASKSASEVIRDEKTLPENRVIH